MKSNILSPLTDLHTIETRLDLVEYLIAGNTHEDLEEVREVLAECIDLDKVGWATGRRTPDALRAAANHELNSLCSCVFQMLSCIATPPMKEDDLNSAKRMIDAVMLLKTWLAALPPVVEKLKSLIEQNTCSNEGNELLEAIVASLSMPVSIQSCGSIQETAFLPWSKEQAVVGPHQSLTALNM